MTFAYAALFLVSAAVIFGAVRRALLYRTQLPTGLAISSAAVIAVLAGAALVWIAASASDVPPCIDFTADASGRC